jgi:hypothetical protein
MTAALLGASGMLIEVTKDVLKDVVGSIAFKSVEIIPVLEGQINSMIIEKECIADKVPTTNEDVELLLRCSVERGYYDVQTRTWHSGGFIIPDIAVFGWYRIVPLNHDISDMRGLRVSRTIGS